MLSAVPAFKAEADVDQMSPFLDSLKWDNNSLVVAIAQHVDTGEVLMQAFADRAAISETLQTGYVLYSICLCLCCRLLSHQHLLLPKVTRTSFLIAGLRHSTVDRGKEGGAREKLLDILLKFWTFTWTVTEIPSFTYQNP